MELWIRSQRNEKLRQGLFKVNEIELGDCDGYMDCIVINNLYCVGIYQTKERALEVLDEIQNLLQPKIKYIQEEPVESIVDFGYQITQNVDMKIQEINRIVYEMPKE